MMKRCLAGASLLLNLLAAALSVVAALGVILVLAVCVPLSTFFCWAGDRMRRKLPGPRVDPPPMDLSLPDQYVEEPDSEVKRLARLQAGILTAERRAAYRNN